MNAVAFDTLEAVRGLEVAGGEHGQAEAIVRTMIAVNDAGRKGLATKADIAEPKVELAAAVNRMLLSRIAVSGLLPAAPKLLWAAAFGSERPRAGRRAGAFLPAARSPASAKIGFSCQPQPFARGH